MSVATCSGLGMYGRGAHGTSSARRESLIVFPSSMRRAWSRSITGMPTLRPIMGGRSVGATKARGFRSKDTAAISFTSSARAMARRTVALTSMGRSALKKEDARGVPRLQRRRHSGDLVRGQIAHGQRIRDVDLTLAQRFQQHARRAVRFRRPHDELHLVDAVRVPMMRIAHEANALRALK